MIGKVAADVENAIREKNYHDAIGILRDWLGTCEQGEPNKLLAACALSIRPSVRDLLCDVLSCYPETLLGFPLLIYGAAKGIEDGFLTLPFPTLESAHPCPGLRFLGWIPCDSSLPVKLPFRQNQHKTEVVWRTPTAYVGVFRVVSEEYEIDVNDVRPLWWGDLFFNHPRYEDDIGNVRLEGNVLFSYPEAIEVAAAMQAGARRSELSQPHDFHENLDWAYQQGVTFSEKCCSEFGDTPLNDME